MSASVAGLSEWLTDFNDAFDRPSPGATSYADLIRLHRDDLPSYRENPQAAITFVRDLQRFSYATDLDHLSDGAPRPRAQLRLTPDDRAAAERLPRAPNPDDEISTH